MAEDATPKSPSGVITTGATSGDYVQVRPYSATAVNFDTAGLRYQFFTSEAPRTSIDSLDEVDTAGSTTYWEPKDQKTPLLKTKSLNSSILTNSTKWAEVTSGKRGDGGYNDTANVYLQSYTNSQKAAMYVAYSRNDSFVYSNSGGYNLVGTTIPLKTMLDNSMYSYDLSWGISPTYTAKHTFKSSTSTNKSSKSQTLFPLTSTPRWYRRVGVQTVEHPTYGKKSFFVATDALSRFYVYPTDYSGETKSDYLIQNTLNGGTYDYFVKLDKCRVWDFPFSSVGEAPTISTYTNLVNETIIGKAVPLTNSSRMTYWDNTKNLTSDSYKDAFHGVEDGYDSKLCNQPYNYLWSFNYNSTRATTIVYKVDTSNPITFKGLDKERYNGYKVDNLQMGLIFNKSVVDDMGVTAIPTVTPVPQPFTTSLINPYVPVLVEVAIAITLTGDKDSDFNVDFSVVITKDSLITDDYYTASGYSRPIFKDDDKNKATVISGNNLAFSCISIYGRSTLTEGEEWHDTVFETPPVWEDEIDDTPQSFKDSPETIAYTKMLMGIEPYSLDIIQDFVKNIPNFSSVENLLSGSFPVTGYPTISGFTWENFETLLTSPSGLTLNNYDNINGTVLTNRGFPCTVILITDTINSDTVLRSTLTTSLRMETGVWNSADDGQYWHHRDNVGFPESNARSKYLEDIADLPLYYTQYNKVDGVETTPIESSRWGKLGYSLYQFIHAPLYELTWNLGINSTNWKYLTGDSKFAFLKHVKTYSQDTQVLNSELSDVGWLQHRILAWGMGCLIIDKIPLPEASPVKAWLKSVFAQSLIYDSELIDFSSSADHQGFIDAYLEKLPKRSGQIVEGMLVMNSGINSSAFSNSSICTSGANVNKPIYLISDMHSAPWSVLACLSDSNTCMGKKVFDVDAYLDIVNVIDNTAVLKAQYRLFHTPYACVTHRASYISNLPKVELPDISTMFLTTPIILPGGGVSAETKHDSQYGNPNDIWRYKTLMNGTSNVMYMSNCSQCSINYRTNKDTFNVSVAALDFGRNAILFNGSASNWHYPETFKLGSAFYIEWEAYRLNGMFADIDITDNSTTEEKLSTRKFRLFYEHIYLNNFKNDIILNPSFTTDNILHDVNAGIVDEGTYQNGSYNNFDYISLQTATVESFINSYPDNKAISVSLLPPLGLCYFMESLFGTSKYADFVRPLVKSKFSSDYRTIDYIQVLNPKFDYTQPPEKQAEKWVVTTHKDLFNSAFSQSRDYSYYLNKNEDGFLGGFATAGAWFTYTLPILDANRTNDKLDKLG